MTDNRDKTALPHHGEAEAKKNDIQALIGHVRENPGVYIGAVAFVLVVLAATGVYRAMQASALTKDSTAYVRALETEDPAERSTEFAAVAASSPRFAARALYLEGEAAIDAGKFDEAKSAFTQLRENYPNFEFLPDAVEGLGFIEEDGGRYGVARTLYEEVASKWPDSAAAQRQPFNLARCYESEENLASAVEQYRKQLTVFPGSTIAVRAQTRLNELRESNPDLFADETTTALQELTTSPEGPAPSDVPGGALDQLELSIDNLPQGEGEAPADAEPAPSGAPGTPE